MTDTYPNDQQLLEFAKASDAIEGLFGPIPDEEIQAYKDLLELKTISVDDLTGFVYMVSGAHLRDVHGRNVRVGSHFPPLGGPQIREMLETFLADLQNPDSPLDPVEAHVRYETIHPYMDGNGRSGRALYLWQVVHQPSWRNHRALLESYGLLHSWYYLTLEYCRRLKR